MTSKTSNKITNLNFLLTIFIVLLHSNCLEYIENINNIYILIANHFINCIVTVAVPTFFALSTILFYKDFSLSNFKKKIIKRCKTLLIPYLIWSIVFLVYFIILTNLSFIKPLTMSIEPIKYNFISFCKYILFAKYASGLWYIRELFILFLLSPIIYQLVKKLKKWNIIIIAIIIILNIYFSTSYFSFLYWLPLNFIFAYITLNKNVFELRLKKYFSNSIILGGGYYFYYSF